MSDTRTKRNKKNRERKQQKANSESQSRFELHSGRQWYTAADFDPWTGSSKRIAAPITTFFPSGGIVQNANPLPKPPPRFKKMKNKRIGPRRQTAVEHKFIDLAAANYNADTTGSVTLLNGVATGTDFTNRVGREFRMRELLIHGFLAKETAVQNEAYCRLLIVFDTQISSGSAPALTDLLTAADSISQLNMNNRRRFQVLVDKRFVLGGTNNTATQAIAEHPGTHVVDIRRGLNHPVVCSGTGATSASIMTGALWMFTVGHSTTSGIFELTTRVVFEDA